MRVLVTGATGFVGGNLVRTLVDRGYDVRALVRRNSNTLALENLGVEEALGDLRDRESIAKALKGCQGVFHCAAMYTFWSRDPAEVYRVNVEGTKVIFEEAERAGVERAVYTSTVSTIGLPKKGLGTEDTQLRPKDLVGHYKKSKYLGEQEALAAASNGLPVVVVNPAAPIGPWDVKPTPTGGIVLDFLRRKLPVYIGTGMNVIDVEDVAMGHVLAMEKGVPGQRYILGHRNMTLLEVLLTLEAITGVRAPRVRIPVNLIILLGMIDYLIEGKLLKRKPRIPLEGMRVAKKPMYVSSAKAVRELGLPQSPVEEALEKAVRWFRDYRGA